MAIASSVSEATRALLTDPQTSGGLLVSCTPETVQQVLDLFAAQGFGDAAIVGRMEAGTAQVVVE
ncbi:selenophosphate synthetase [compost metagenome]